jgi:ABC-type cobalamin/Fe3+-siderophores transport system ATPase subunit
MPISTDSRCPDTGYLTVQGLTVGYDAAPIINDISLTVAEGEVVTMIGPNGAGKSTLLKCLTGRLRPQAGQVLLYGHDVTHDVRANAPVARFRVLADSEPSPSQ